MRVGPVVAVLGVVAFGVAGLGTVIAPVASAGPLPGDPNAHQPFTMQVGEAPKGIAVAGGMGAVANSDANTVTVFKACSPKVCWPQSVGTVTVGSDPSDTAVAVDPYGQSGRVYVTNSGDGTVTVVPYSYSTLQVLQPATTVAVGGEPTGIALSPDAKWAYISDKESNRLLVLDTASLTVAGSAAVGNGPWGVAVSPDGARAYVADNILGAVTVVDTASRTAVATIPVGKAPGELALDPSGRTLWVPNNADGTVSVIDTTTNQVVSSVPVGSQPWGVGVTDTHAFVANYGSNTVSVIDASTRKVIATVHTQKNPFGVAVNYGYTVLVSNTGSDSLSTIALKQYAPSVTWSSSKAAKSVTGKVPMSPAVTYSMIAKKGSATKKGSCAVSGAQVSCTVKLSSGSWRVSIQTRLPWQPVALGAQNKKFTF